MHLDLPHLIYSGEPIDEPSVLDRLPAPFRDALGRRNGCVAYRGALHIRGAARAPEWHALHRALEGPTAFHRLYPSVEKGDLPFAEDAFGDQFLLRKDRVWKLSAESGDLSNLSVSLEGFFDLAIADVPKLLGYEPADALAQVGHQLLPGRQIMAYPPFVLDIESGQRSFKAVPTHELRGFLATFAAKVRNLPDGARVDLTVTD